MLKYYLDTIETGAYTPRQTSKIISEEQLLLRLKQKQKKLAGMNKFTVLILAILLGLNAFQFIQKNPSIKPANTHLSQFNQWDIYATE